MEKTCWASTIRDTGRSTGTLTSAGTGASTGTSRSASTSCSTCNGRSTGTGRKTVIVGVQIHVKLQLGVHDDCTYNSRIPVLYSRWQYKHRLEYSYSFEAGSDMRTGPAKGTSRNIGFKTSFCIF